MSDQQLKDNQAVAGKVTSLLLEVSGGNRVVVDDLIPLLYQELKRIARGHLRRERPDHTVQATALVNEAYLKLIDQREANWQNRAHFFGIASQVMRRILLDYAKGRARGKRGGGAHRTSFDEALAVSEDRVFDLMDIDEALRKLEALDPRQAKIVEMRFFAGLSVEETAEAIGVSEPTVKRDWAMAKAWLYRELSASTPG